TALIVLASVVVSVSVIACLYWAQSIFIPLGMAVFLTFLLSPLVSFLQRKGIGRVPAALGTLFLAALLLGALIWLITAQASALLAGMPEYKDRIRDRLEPVIVKVEAIRRDVGEVLGSEPGDKAPAGDKEEKKPVVVVKDDTSSWLSSLLPAAHGLGGT